MRPIIRTVTASLLVMSAIIGACTRTDSIGPDSSTSVSPSLRVSVSPAVDTIQTGSSIQLTARVSDERNVTRDVAVEWRTDNPAVASVSSTGSVAALSLGTAHIVALAGAASDTALVVVQSPPTLTVSPGAALVMLGDSLRLTASATSATGAAASVMGVQWVSSDPTIATVTADGVMNAVEEGSVTITAQMSSATASASVQVLRGSVASITVAPLNATVRPNESLQLVATTLDADGRLLQGVTPKWTTSNPSIATVTDDGLVTGVAKGFAIITAQAKSKKATASVNVLDVPAATVAVMLGSSSLSARQTTQATAIVKDAQGTVLTGRTIAWQSSNPAVATVDSKGLVTAIANGSVTISAICEAKVGGAPLTVSSPVPTTIAIIPQSVSLKLGGSAQLAAEVRDAKGVVIPHQAVTWSSANATIAPISASGSVSAANVGSTSVLASADGLTASAPVTVSEVTAGSIVVSPSTLALTVGDTARLTSTVRDPSGSILSGRVVNWSSSNNAVATVGTTGLVTAVGAGSVTVSAVVDGVTSSATVNVAAPRPEPVASVSVTLLSASLAVGQTTQASAVLRDAAGNTLTGRTVSWSSANTSVATVSTTGQVTAVSAGSASIVATSEGQAGGATVTVAAPAPAPVASVTLSASPTTLVVGTTLQVTVTLRDLAGNPLSGRTISWTSSNTTVATVSPSGVVAGLTPGSVTVTAASEGKSGSIQLTVAPPPVASVTVVLSAPSLYVGQTTQATATMRDAAGNVLTGRSVTWSSSVPGVATVSAAGMVSTLAAGSTNIVAVSEGKTGSAVLNVTTPPVTSPPPSCSVVTGTALRATSALGKPGYLQSVTDPDFGTRITRITGDPGTPIGYGIAGNWPTVAYHNYSKDPVFTADQKLLVLKHMSGVPTPGAALFLDGTTYQPLFSRGGPSGGGEWRLHPTLPDIAVYLNGSGAVGHWNVRTNTSTVKVQAVSGYSSNEMGPYEGNVSRDGRYVVAAATRSSDNHRVARVIDIDGGRAEAVIDLTAANVTDLDWVSISAGGNYVVANGTIDGGSQRTKVWRRDGTVVATWSDYILGHYDLGFDQAGNEVAFGAVASGSYGKRFIARRLDNGAVTALSGPTSYNWHAGTRGPAGWGFAATNDRTGSALDGEIYAFKLDGSGTVQRYAHHRSNNVDYDSAPFPTASPDGKRVVFASNWMSSGRPVQAYVVDIRPICP